VHHLRDRGEVLRDCCQAVSAICDGVGDLMSNPEIAITEKQFKSQVKD